MNSINQTSAFYTSNAHANPGNGFFSFLPEIQTLEFLLAVTVFVSIHSLRQRKRQGLPVWPVLGMFPSLLAGLRAGLYDWLTGVLASCGGTFMFRGPWFTDLESCLITADPRNLEHMLKTRFANFPKGGFFHYLMQDFLGNGIFSADDEAWRLQRKTTGLEFHTAEFRALTAESLVELVHSRLLPVLEAAATEDAAVDLQDVLLRLTFDNVCMIAFGTDPGCLSVGLPEIPFARAFEEATEATMVRFFTPTGIWEAMRYFNLGSERCLKSSIKEVDEFAYEVIRTRKKELLAESATSQERTKTTRSDLLTVFMKMKDENGKEFSEKYLRDVCVNIILAGRDTSSVALAWFFWLLNEHPEVEERILEELKEIVKQSGNSDDELVFRPEEVKKMDYLQAALSEALRLYPSVPNDLKQVVEDDVLPDGTKLKGGTRVIYAIYSMGRMESIWGKDCREFKPERWLRADGRFISESAYKFTAFNGGPRLCLGKDFAYYQMKFVAASILRRFHVQVVGNHPVVPRLALTMYMKHGLKVTLSRRRNKVESGRIAEE